MAQVSAARPDCLISVRPGRRQRRTVCCHGSVSALVVSLMLLLGVLNTDPGSMPWASKKNTPTRIAAMERSTSSAAKHVLRGTHSAAHHCWPQWRCRATAWLASGWLLPNSLSIAALDRIHGGPPAAKPNGLPRSLWKKNRIGPTSTGLSGEQHHSCSTARIWRSIPGRQMKLSSHTRTTHWCCGFTWLAHTSAQMSSIRSVILSNTASNEWRTTRTVAPSASSAGMGLSAIHTSPGMACPQARWAATARSLSEAAVTENV
mmetsp:Transcript_9345/g.36480  ORF Transcript_9345/g.36480 Transcript_9345/m.36480 type:complete len:261 (-) Transcript_9345:440-1222(-)